MNYRTKHIPVLLNETIKALCIRNKELYVDATFGVGGYTNEILKKNSCSVLAIDRDPEAKMYSDYYKGKYKNRFFFQTGKFSDVEKILNSQKIDKVAGIVFDLGVSSPQLDQGNRGFSFRLNGPLDMRMSKEGPTAEEFINKVDEKTLADIIYELGDEIFSKRIAKLIIRERSKDNIVNTIQLAKIIRAAIPKSKNKTDPATKTFQAIRMYLNDEISELETGLKAAERILKPDGILAVVSFHSIEDRIIKNFFLKCSKNKVLSRYMPEQSIKMHSLEVITKKPITPSELEIKTNIRSRSAKLRVARRTKFPSLFGDVA